MIVVQEIPLQGIPETFGITVAGVAYIFTLRWRDGNEGGWVLDIADSLSAPIVSGIPLVTGADLLAQYPTKGFGFGLAVQTDHDPDAVPTFSNLGTTAHLYAVLVQ